MNKHSILFSAFTNYKENIYNTSLSKILDNVPTKLECYITRSSKEKKKKRKERKKETDDSSTNLTLGRKALQGTNTLAN
jgi:hypothetical protein